MTRRLLIFAAAAALSLAAASPAAADSISYVKDGNIWLTTPDGSRQHQVTHGGGYTFASQADDGTLIGLYGRRLHRISPADGKVLADFETPVSHDAGPNNSSFKGPFDPAISPDGKKVAYAYNHETFFVDPGCTPPNCTEHRIEVGIGYSHADRLTPWEEPGMGRQSGWTHPSWIDNQQLLMSERSVIFGNTDSIIDTMGDGNQTIEYWFNDDNAWYLHDGEIARTGDKAAFVGQAPNGMTADIVAIYKMNGRAPALPEACYHYIKPDGSYDSPSFSPDGRRIAIAQKFGHNPGILVGDVPDFSGGCQQPAAGATMLIPGGAEPDWGPADVPVIQKQGDKGNTKKGKLKLRARKSMKLGAALRKGVVLTVSPGAAGKASAAARSGKAKVGSGKARVGKKGSAKLRVKFTKRAKRALKRKKAVRLKVAVTFKPAAGGSATKGSATIRLKR